MSVQWKDQEDETKEVLSNIRVSLIEVWWWYLEHEKSLDI